MKNVFEDESLSLEEKLSIIELKARKERAEYIASGISSLFRKIKSIFRVKTKEKAVVA